MPVQESEFVALVSQDMKDDFVEVEMRNKFSVGDVLEVLSPDDKTFNKKIKIETIINSNGENFEAFKSSSQSFCGGFFGNISSAFL